MGTGAGGEPAAPESRPPVTPRLVAVGCFTAFLGVVSGGMIAVLVSKFVAFVTRAPACTGIPTCDWYLYWAAGAVIGGITLPWLAVRALRRSGSADHR
jgi:hypothetical protein